MGRRPRAYVLAVAFTELRTRRLLLRRVRPDDARALTERRNDPEVAHYQDWATPFPVERATALVDELVTMDAPTRGEWWMLTIADVDDSSVFGDLAVHLSDDGHTAEIGYTLARSTWGRGYAVEATTALVEYLFESVGVTRIEGRLHPDNIASAMVLERIGMLHEGHTRLSYWLGDDNSDDWLYGMIAPDWWAWRDRPRHRPDTVGLVEITPDTAYEVHRLATHRSQRRFVAPVAASFANALFPEVVDGAPLEPWLRAVDADGELVGFVMLARSNDVHRDPYLWRLLVDRLHQRRGVGSAVIDLVVDQCRRWNDTSLLTSWVPGKGSPEPLYLAKGFAPTGLIVDGEIEGRCEFD